MNRASALALRVKRGRSLSCEVPNLVATVPFTSKQEAPNQVPLLFGVLKSLWAGQARIIAVLPRLGRVLRQVLAVLIVLNLASAPLCAESCPDADGAARAGHHHRHGHPSTDCAACCSDCLSCAVLAQPDSGVALNGFLAVQSYNRVGSILFGRSLQPEPDPPRPIALS